MEEEGERGGVAEREEADEEECARPGDAGHEREEEQAERHVGRAGQRQPPLQLTRSVPADAGVGVPWNAVLMAPPRRWTLARRW